MTQWAERDCGWSWSALAALQSSSAWLTNCTKTSIGQVKLNSDLSGSFPIINGMKQGCFLALTLFSIFFSMMLKQVIDDGAVYIHYCLDSSLFNLRRLHAHSRTLEQLFRDLFAAFIAYAKRALQYLTSCFAEAAQLFGFKVSLKKTEVLHQPTPLEVYYPPHITIGGTELKSVHQFTYLGCTVLSDAKINSEVDNRLANANSAFSRLYKRVWNNKHLKKSKISIYRSLWSGRNHQHRGHVAEVTATMGRACLENAGEGITCPR